MSGRSSDEARRLALAFAAWEGLLLLEDPEGQVCRATGCEPAEAWAVWDAYRALLVRDYAALTHATPQAAETALTTADTRGGLAEAMPEVLGRRWRLERGA